MKALFLGLILLGLGARATAASADGQLVRGPTYEGVIFTPEMLPQASEHDPEPLIVGGIWPAKATYWTPTAQQVRRFEQAFARAVARAHKRLPAPGAHARDYYAPKFFSRDWQKSLPTDLDSNFLYRVDPSWLTPQLKRQYIGVTVKGRPLLVMNAAYDEKFVDPKKAVFLELANWKHAWFYIYDAGHQIFYDPHTGELWEIDT